MKITIEGPQGSGKTTLVEALNKLIRTQAGEFPGIRVNFRPEQQFRRGTLIPATSWDGVPREYWYLEDIQPAPALPTAVPLVPLGANRTRDGREVWVVSLTGGSAVEPLICFLKNGDNWDQVYYPTTGAGETVHPRAELIGHLPPEPPKPREIWVNLGTLNIYTTPTSLGGQDLTHFREVLP